MSKIDCSFIFPLLNESENIEISYNKINEIMSQTNYSYEIIYVNDGSTDNSAEIIKKLCNEHKNVKLISFSRNFGQQAASLAGLKHATGKCAINLDIDLEEDPNMIIDMLSKWKEGYDVVTIKRKSRKERVVKKFFSWCYYKIMKWLGVKNIDNLAEFRLLDRKVIDEICKMNEHNIFLRNQTNWIGFRQITLKADRSKRLHGKTKYNFKRSAKLAIQGIVSSTSKPLYFSFGLSFIFYMLTILSTISLVVLNCCKVYFNTSLWLIPIMLVCTATILLVLGFIGMYLAFTYDEARNRPIYIISEKINVED